jgi:hypothetical protein
MPISNELYFFGLKNLYYARIYLYIVRATCTSFVSCSYILEALGFKCEEKIRHKYFLHDNHYLYPVETVLKEMWRRKLVFSKGKTKQEVYILD